MAETPILRVTNIRHLAKRLFYVPDVQDVVRYPR